MLRRMFGWMLVAAMWAPQFAGAVSDLKLAGQTVTTQIAGGQQTREYAVNGQLIYEVIENTGSSGAVDAIEREWYDTGTPIRDQQFVGGKEVKGTVWYMNGQVKETRVDQTLRGQGGLPGTYVERFSDTGGLLFSGVYQGQLRPVGVHRQYNEAGKLVREITYDANGTKLSEKTFGPGGTLQGNATYYPDGSRKLK